MRTPRALVEKEEKEDGVCGDEGVCGDDGGDGEEWPNSGVFGDGGTATKTVGTSMTGRRTGRRSSGAVQDAF